MGRGRLEKLFTKVSVKASKPYDTDIVRVLKQEPTGGGSRYL